MQPEESVLDHVLWIIDAQELSEPHQAPEMPVEEVLVPLVQGGLRRPGALGLGLLL